MPSRVAASRGLIGMNRFYTDLPQSQQRVQPGLMLLRLPEKLRPLAWAWLNTKSAVCEAFTYNRARNGRCGSPDLLRIIHERSHSA